MRSLIAETYLRSLEIEDINVISSGTNVSWGDPQEKEYFANTLTVLDRHNIKHLAKSVPDQLTSERLSANGNIIILMNQRVVDEAIKLVALPLEAQNWEITDIGEGHRTDPASREKYQEDIYQEITRKVDRLLLAYNK